MRLLEVHRQQILEIAARHGARNLRIFGSFARGEDRDDSDLDLLVDLEQGRSLVDLIGLQQDLSQLLRRRVEVVTQRGLSPHLKQKILAEAHAL